MFKQQPINRLLLVLGLAIAVLVAAVVTVLTLTFNKQSRVFSSGNSSQSNTSHIHPSLSPSVRFQNHRPSTSPSMSSHPTSSPTHTPSLAPSTNPTEKPSGTPSKSPSMSPSSFPSLLPTISPFDFALKMHWEADYFWQDTFQEFRWCIECTKCINLTDTDDGPQLCKDDDSNDPTCKENDQIWIQNCGPKRGNAVFNVERYPNHDVLRIKGTDLCLTRTTDRYVRLEKCTANIENQKWRIITLDLPFDLRGLSPNDYRCLTQAHHPKAAEILHMKNCDVAYAHRTALWDAIPVS